MHITSLTLLSQRNVYLSLFHSIAAAIAGMAYKGQLNGQPLEAYRTCVASLAIGSLAYIIGRALTTESVASGTEDVASVSDTLSHRPEYGYPASHASDSPAFISGSNRIS